MGRDITTLDDLTPNNLGVFKKINESVLPTTYPEQWYQDLLNSDQIVKLAYFSELPVGAIKAKAIVTKAPSHKDQVTMPLLKDVVPSAVYIELLAVLPAYQHHGLGTKMLQFVEEQTKERFIHEIVLHVHSQNVEAIKWYEAHGFSRGDVVQGYYLDQGLDNPDAVIFSKKV